jgi:hypothetical protein
VLRDSLAADGARVRTAYGYGCVLCRRVDRPSGVPGATVREAAHNGHLPSARTTVRGGDRTGRARLGRAVRTLHGHLDALELEIKLILLRLRARRSPDASWVLLTDRGPLDGLAKHDPPPGSRLARRYLRVAAAYDALVVLDAPAHVLAARDGEHSGEELELWRALFACWAAAADEHGARTSVVDTTERSVPAISADVLRHIGDLA